MLLSFLVLGAGVAVMLYSSNKVVEYGKKVALALDVHPFLIGITLVSIGTDLPEIFNAVWASFLGHGDINVGDSLGSAITQITLIGGFLAFVSRPFKVDRREVVTTGSLTVVALFFLSIIVSDGFLSRMDGLMLIGLWFLSIFFTEVATDLDGTRSQDFSEFRRDLLMMVIGFAGILVGSYFAVDSIIKISRAFVVQEYLVSLIVMGLGTSLPELVVYITAILKGESEIAIGNLIGSSLVDATVSIGIGSALFPVAVSSQYIVPSILLGVMAAGIVTVVLGITGRVNRAVGIIFSLVYIKFLVASIGWL